MSVITAELLRSELGKLTRVLSAKMEESVESLRQELGSMRQRVLDLENHAERQGVEVDELRSAVGRRDARNRHFLVFDGPGVPPPPVDREPWRENVSETVVETVRKYLPDIEVRAADIVQSYRAGRGKGLSVSSCLWARTVFGSASIKSVSR